MTAGTLHLSRELRVIFSRCEEEGEHCWIWQQGCNGAGCPSMYFSGKRPPVRRRVFELWHGREAKPGHYVVAWCGQQRCVSPYCARELVGRDYRRYLVRIGALNNAAHLAATAAANRRRSTTKLTAAKAAEIRARLAAGSLQKDVAVDFDISSSQVSKIARGESWAIHLFPRQQTERRP